MTSLFAFLILVAEKVTIFTFASLRALKVDSKLTREAGSSICDELGAGAEARFAIVSLVDAGSTVRGTIYTKSCDLVSKRSVFASQGYTSSVNDEVARAFADCTSRFGKAFYACTRTAFAYVVSFMKVESSFAGTRAIFETQVVLTLATGELFIYVGALGTV